ncbi:hypothetical protein CANCADRAFT_2450 [Tortispora caseinolytica NRRL Y-17796]|uniref:DUF1446-domain-containing protein n=1 Tax=Tortispora caseinolytica NRRL Y-17796 TaxID=767744 RepID=A0A1E4TG20_9ASCO|nr:hypothetical protein CANCADRAFT_2450 [Tortispora caseinolytica NRRL Y-17796]
MAPSKDSPRRPIRIANCSGATPDPGSKMLEQAVSGPVDAIVGDYLAEFNIALNATGYHEGKHPGWEPTCEEGLMLTIDEAAKRGIKIVVNGGELNPKGLAQKVAEEAATRGLDLQVSYVEGDDLFESCQDRIKSGGVAHLDSSNNHVKLAKDTDLFLKDSSASLLTANAYLGGRGICAALNAGADIVICGRVADASPVIGLGLWWHNWQTDQYDELAGALIAGHLIECSGYSTGGNFSDFERYPMERLIDIGYPIAELAYDGTSVITKHESLNGIVNVDNLRTQFLYELQGNVYLNSDVKADITNIVLKGVGPNRVSVTGVKGLPPPPTTKLAIFYDGGYELESWVYATGRNSDVKFDLMEKQVRLAFKQLGVADKIDVVEFQRYGRVDHSIHNQMANTAGLRIIVHTRDEASLKNIARSFIIYGMQPFHGAHHGNLGRAGSPRKFPAYYPGVIEQSQLKECAVLLSAQGEEIKRVPVQPVAKTESLQPRDNFSITQNPVDLSTFGPTVNVPLSKVVLGRSGDKGGNINMGMFVHTPEEWDWLRTVMTTERMIELIGEDWRPEFYVERVEFPNIYAVHFVIYGILDRGVSSSTILDAFGKGFADYILDREVDIPKKFVDYYAGRTYDVEKPPVNPKI